MVRYMQKIDCPYSGVNSPEGILNMVVIREPLYN